MRLLKESAYVYTEDVVAVVHYHAGNLTHPRHAAKIERDRRVRAVLKLLEDADDLDLDDWERRATRRSLRRDARRLLYHASRAGLSEYRSANVLLWGAGVRMPILDAVHALRAVIASLSTGGAGAR